MEIIKRKTKPNANLWSANFFNIACALIPVLGFYSPFAIKAFRLTQAAPISWRILDYLNKMGLILFILAWGGLLIAAAVINLSKSEKAVSSATSFACGFYLAFAVFIAFAPFLF